MTISDGQFRRLMKAMRDHGVLRKAALQAGMSENTARKYLEDGRSPKERRSERHWRTRPDPFEEHWPEILERLEACPDLQAITLLEDLCERFPDRYQEGQVRTLQRRVRRWRAEEGPPKEVFFQQEHRPGEALQVDFTCAKELAIRIDGAEFGHLLCHPVLPFSNWEWVTVCRSESFVALKRGTQAALVRLGGSPSHLQTDNSTAATHDLKKDAGRAFNAAYLEFTGHYSMTPRTIAVGKKQQNGDVESSHNALKRYLKQALLMRGSSDFGSISEYEGWLQACAERRNKRRRQRFEEEVESLRSLPARILPEYTTTMCSVSKWSTIRVLKKTYSVPSRLIGVDVHSHVYDDRIDVYYGGQRAETIERIIGSAKHRIDYRHVIWSLVRKPGAFRLYKYREDLFPTIRFKKAHERLLEARPSGRRADLEYLRILFLAASTTETAVDEALETLLSRDELPEIDKVTAIAAPREIERPQIEIPAVCLGDYDSLLREERAS